MKRAESLRSRLETRALVTLVILATLGLGWIIMPFFGAILWGVVAAILFGPVKNILMKRMPKHKNLAAALTLLIIIASVILPAMIVGANLLQEASVAYAKFQAGPVDVEGYFHKFQNALPLWSQDLLKHFGLTDFDLVSAKLTAGISDSFKSLLAQTVNIGQSIFGFFLSLVVMLCLTFFLLRDGDKIAQHMERVAPINSVHLHMLIDKFIIVVRATIKGSFVIAILQGVIGGLVFWILGIDGVLLWGVSMGMASMLPAVGTGLVWVPVAAYLLATGALWQGLVLIFCGLFVIGIVDNVVRPILVGKDTGLPEYVVLISTLGGLEIFGFSGLLIGPVIAALFVVIWDIFSTPLVQSGEVAE